jgi:hypothetical protein
MLKLRRADIDAHWEGVVLGLAKGLEVLRDDCGVVNGQWLPYSPMLVPLMAVLAKQPLDHAPDSGARRAKLIKWFWCASLSGRYESAANTRSEEDYEQLANWLKGGAEPTVVNNFVFGTNGLVDVTPRQRARYRALMCLALRSDPTAKKDRARDFNTGSVINSALVRQEEVDDHHIFPRSYLEKNPQPRCEAADSILNHTLIDAVTNRHKIRDRAPSDYLGDVRSALHATGADIEALLKSHMIHGAINAAIWHDDFEGFLKERTADFEAAVAEVSGKKLVPATIDVQAPP